MKLIEECIIMKFASQMLHSYIYFIGFHGVTDPILVICFFFSPPCLILPHSLKGQLEFKLTTFDSCCIFFLLL